MFRKLVEFLKGKPRENVYANVSVTCCRPMPQPERKYVIKKNQNPYSDVLLF